MSKWHLRAVNDFILAHPIEEAVIIFYGLDYLRKAIYYARTQQILNRTIDTTGTKPIKEEMQQYITKLKIYSLLPFPIAEPFRMHCYSKIIKLAKEGEDFKNIPESP